VNGDGKKAYSPAVESYSATPKALRFADSRSFAAAWLTPALTAGARKP
jgi:hypothetical protein